MKTFIERHLMPTYFPLAFATSWGGMLLMIGGPSGLATTSARFERLMPMVWLAYAARPSGASLLSTGLISRGEGLRELLSRFLRWRLNIRWYAVALLTAPLIAGVIFFGLSFRSPQFIPVIVTTHRDLVSCAAPLAARGVRVGSTQADKAHTIGCLVMRGKCARSNA